MESLESFLNKNFIANLLTFIIAVIYTVFVGKQEQYNDYYVR